jgi:hypothetical protein
MQPEKKAPPTTEVSLNYMSWSVKDLIKEVQKLNISLEAINATLSNITSALISNSRTPF